MYQDNIGSDLKGGIYMYCKQTGSAKRHKVGAMKDKVCVDEKELYYSLQRVIA